MSRTVKVLFLLALVGLSAFYLAVLKLARHPDVSYAYRLYYMELKTRFWNRNQTLAYVPGMRFDMVNDRAWILSRPGWTLPKDDGTGTEFTGKGGLYFTLHAVPAHLRMVADVRNMQADNTLTLRLGDWSQTVHLQAKGPQRIIIGIPVTTLIADPLQANYIDMQSRSPIRFHAMTLDDNEE